MPNIPENLNGILSTVLPFVLMIALLYLLMIRPQRKQQKQLSEMRNNLEVGDEVTTIGGIIGRVCLVKEDDIVIETSADKTKIKLAKWGISTKVNREDVGK